MDAAGLASLIAPSWFQSVSDLTGPQHAGVANWTAQDTLVSSQQDATSQSGQSNLYDWIVQFDTASLAGIESVAETTSLLAGGGIEFQAIYGLGLAGQVLVRSSGASFDTVTNWLASDVHVASFEQDAIRQADITPNDSLAGNLWGMTKIDAQDAWSIGTGSSSVVVAVIDTGVDYTHPDLAANIWTNPGEIAGNGVDDDGNGFVDDLHGYDFANNDGNPMDDNNHGTHVSGTIAAVGNNSMGVEGVNWSSSIMALKFLNSQGSGYLSDAVRAVNYATMMRTQYGVNIRVENNSWGGGGFSSAMQSAIQANSDAGILFVAAAGNSGSNNDTSPQYPGNYTSANVISVAATDRNDQLASFSSYGATTVDIAAPGVSIYSTLPGNTYGSYSGTSMATPHVAGVAALAWSVDPNASVADIRNAILQGADPVAGLSGKVATGGRLNAYNTLRLLDGQQPQGPTVGSVTATPNPVMAGSVVTLTARDITDSAGTVASVYFSLDTNHNGQSDSGDQIAGSTTTIVGGTASIQLNTGSLAPGTYRYFAAALDNNAHWSAAVATTLTVLAADDYGNNASTAAAVGVPSLTQGTLAVAGDVDWFKFQAVAGKSYTFTTQLGALRDSVLFLYDRNGTTLLTQDDDGAGNLASKIQWTASASGTYYIAVAGYNNSYSGTYALSVQMQNGTPVLADIADLAMSHSQTSLSIPLSASDPDGDPLSYSVQMVAVDPLAQKAYDLDQQLRLYQWGGTYFTNLRGASEKYLTGISGNSWPSYFILPSGALYRWESSLADSTLIATLTPAYWNDPSLLWNATQPTTLLPVSSADVSASVSGNVLTIDRAASYANDFVVRVTASDGAASAADSFKVSVTNAAPTLADIADRTMSHSQTSQSIALNVTDADGDSLSYSVRVVAVDPIAQEAYNLDQQLRLYQWGGTYFTNLRGASEKYLTGISGNTWPSYFILPSGDLYRWGSSIADSTLVATLSSAYWNDPSLLWNAQRPTALLPVSSADVSASVSNGVLTIARAADYANDFVVRVTVSDGAASATDSFKVSVTNSAPTLAHTADRTMSHTQTSQPIALNVNDADGDPLSYSAQVVATDPVAQKAYTLDQQLNLYQWGGTYFTNLRGASEKYLTGISGNTWPSYFILPSGDLYRWGSSIADSTLVATLSPTYWNDPSLLWSARQPTTLLPVSNTDVTVSVSDNVLTVARAEGYTNNFVVRLTVSDGTATATDSFSVSIVNAAPELSAIGDQALPASQNTLQLDVAASDPDGDPLRYSTSVSAADPVALKAYNLDQQLHLYQWGGTYFTNLRGANEKYLTGVTGDTWPSYFILPSGGLYRWGGSMTTSTLVDTLSPAYWTDPSLLWNAQPPMQAASVSGSVTASMVDGVLTINRTNGYASDFFVQVTATDGLNTTSTSFRVQAASNTAPQSIASLSAFSLLAEEQLDAPSVLPPAIATTYASALAWARMASDSLVNRISHATINTLTTALPLAETSALHDDVIGRLTVGDDSHVGIGRLGTFLDYHAAMPKLADIATSSAEHEEMSTAYLMADHSLEQHVLDEIFALLGELD